MIITSTETQANKLSTVAATQTYINVFTHGSKTGIEEPTTKTSSIGHTPCGVVKDNLPNHVRIAVAGRCAWSGTVRSTQRDIGVAGSVCDNFAVRADGHTLHTNCVLENALAMA